MLNKIDKNIIKECLKNNPQAQRQLYNVLLPYLRAVATRYLSDNSYAMDVLQESFVKIFKNIAQFDINKSPFKNWAARIVINSCLNYNKRIIGQATEEFNNATHDISIKSEDLKSFSDEHLLVLLKQMPKKYYAVFNLSIIDGYSHSEIAEILGISEANSRKQLSRARQWLKDVFKNGSDVRSYLRAL